MSRLIEIKISTTKNLYHQAFIPTYCLDEKIDKNIMTNSLV